MPYISIGEPGQVVITPLEDLNYKYPDRLDWTPGSELHNRVASRLLQRGQDARNAIQTRFPRWREMDRKLRAYISPEEYSRLEKSGSCDEPDNCRGGASVSDEPRIVFPYTYSMLEGLLTYLSAAFLQDPVFQYEGVEADDTIGAALLELVIQLHCQKTKVALAIHTALRDSLAYGYGVAIPDWQTQYGKRIVRTTDPYQSTVMADSLLFEGNALRNVDPYMVLADPNVSSVGVQHGEFFGWMARTNYMQLAAEEDSPNSEYFNVKYLRQTQQARSALALDNSGLSVPGERTHRALMSTNQVDVMKMYVNLIPSEWGLGNSDRPEKWFFELASDTVIIRAGQASHNHGLYPVAVASPEFDGYSAFPIGRMEVLNGLQDTLDFLFNSHITNIRKSLNDMFIVDPFLINIKDLENPGPGKLIRMRKPAWGRGVGDAVKQLTVSDVTRANVGDANYILQFMDRVSGADTAMQGMLRQGGPERLTSAEFMGTQQNAMGRLQRLAQSISLQFMQDIAMMFAVNTQQYMSDETFVRITGRHAERLLAIYGRDVISVKPKELSINYDVVPRDGSVPGSQGAQVMMQMFEVIAKTPELMQSFDVTRIFSYIASQYGVKNVDDFKRNINTMQAQAMPDQQVEQQVQAGNLVPMPGGTLQ